MPETKMSHPITNVHGSMLVGSTHPYTDEEGSPAGQEFEFSWVIEERELFWTDARTVHAFKSPLFRLPDLPDPSVTRGSSRMQLQIEVPPFLTETSRIPCRFVLVNPPGDLFEVTLNGHPYILKNRSEKEGIHFMMTADIMQKETRRSKFYAYEFHLRISSEEMEWNAFGTMVDSTTATTVAAGSPPGDGLESGNSSGNSATASGPTSPIPVNNAATIRLPPAMLEDDRVNLTFTTSDQVIVAKKSTLCSKSERFREMMNGMVRGNRIRIPSQFSFPTMKEVVWFLQYGYCENWEYLVEEIAEAAVYFKVDSLERLADHKRSLLD